MVQIELQPLSSLKKATSKHCRILARDDVITLRHLLIPITADIQSIQYGLLERDCVIIARCRTISHLIAQRSKTS